MYRVVVAFKDLEDNGHVYKLGDEFPRKNVDVLEERIAELSSTNNKRGVVLIEEVLQKRNRRKKK